MQKEDLKKIIIGIKTSVKDALIIIGSGTVRLAIVADKDQKLLGIITDGDVRRGLLKGVKLEDGVEKIMNATPTTMLNSASKKEILQKMIDLKHVHMPIVDKENRIVNLEIINDLVYPQKKNNSVLIMAGGLGQRLRPLTDEFPKPLLKVGEKPILETIIEQFKESGFSNFLISVNYKGEMIKSYFKDGQDRGINIQYIEEKEPLGTAGCLKLILDSVQTPIFVMNGDVLTKVNFDHLLAEHTSSASLATMCVRKYSYQVPYGVIYTNQKGIERIDEKPIQEYFVNAGIYLLSPEALEHLPTETSFSMTDVFEKLIKLNKKTTTYLIKDYWIDIGQQGNFEQANLDYFEIFNKK